MIYDDSEKPESECTHDCSSCSANCSSRSGEKQSLIEQPHKLSHIKKVIGVVSGKGGVGKSIVTSMLAVLMNRKGYSASTGMNHFAGDATLVFSRMRYVSDGDYGRTDRQRRVIAAVINSLKDAGLTEIMGLINQILPYVTTDLTNAEIVSYATAGLTALANGGEISSSRIPQNDAHYNASIRGMAVLVPDLKMCQEDLKDFIYSEE